jgi:cytochrome c biogenesis protein CcmG/thiol:disulfide interchange protein DsbE
VIQAPSVRKVWKSRWLRAMAVAALVAAWPACAIEAGGAPAPVGTLANLNFTLKDTNGREVSLASFKGRPILLNFWATWCPPCKAETPFLVELAEKYKDQRLAVIGVSFDDSPEDIKAFVNEFKVNYPMLVGRDQDKLFEEYEATFALPVSWFIRPDGSVAMKATGIHEKAWFDDQLKTLTGGAS